MIWVKFGMDNMGKIQTKFSHGSRDANLMSSAKRPKHQGSIPVRSDIASPLHRAAYKIVPGATPWGSRCRSVKLTTHLYVKSRVRIRGSLPPFPHVPSRCWAQLSRPTITRVSFSQYGYYRMNTEKHFPIQRSQIP